VFSFESVLDNSGVFGYSVSAGACDLRSVHSNSGLGLASI